VLLGFLASALGAHAGGFGHGPKLFGSDAVGAARQGSSVAVSADGTTVVVGGTSDGSSAGAAWVFTRTGNVWAQQGAKLVGIGAVGSALQGSAVAVSADGNTVLVGGSSDASGIGATWVFARSNGVWSQQGNKLVGTGGTGASHQGQAVALSADGDTALVGGANDASNAGAAWVFTRTNGVWTQQGAKLVGTGGTAAQQGQAVALSADGNTAIVGGPADASATGAIWVFTRSGSVWTQQGAKLTGTGAAGAAFLGAYLAASSDGSTALAGGYADGADTGAAWVFTRSGGTWSQQGPKLIGSGAVGLANQGKGVALSGDGDTALVGGAFDDGVRGAIWVFRRSAGVWTQQGPKITSVGSNGAARFGAPIALSGDATTAIAGAFQDSSNAGAAFALTRSCAQGDANGDGSVDVGDVFYLINFLFAGGAAPACS
jgi:hypothetical protein